MFAQLPLIKVAAQVVSGLGVSKIVSDIVRNNVVIQTTAQAVTVKAGAFVLGSMLVEQSSNHIDRTVTDIAAWFEKKNEDQV